VKAMNKTKHFHRIMKTN